MLYKNINFLTFDIEEWYYANYQSTSLHHYQNKKTNLDYLIDKLINICDEYKVRATCFIVGKIAKEKPIIVKKLYRAGHEIASHSFHHCLIYNMSWKQFKRELIESKAILENIISKKVIGYRAPSWSVNKKIINWYYNILSEVDYKYSSSIFPTKNFLFGIPDSTDSIHYPIIENKQSNIVEIPISVTNIFNHKVGFSGGFYFRFFPYFFIKNNIKNYNKNKKSVVIYLHPRELDKNQPRLKLNYIENFIHYWGINNCRHKFENLLADFHRSFTLSIGDAYRKGYFKKILQKK